MLAIPFGVVVTSLLFIVTAGTLAASLLGRVLQRLLEDKRAKDRLLARDLIMGSALSTLGVCAPMVGFVLRRNGIASATPVENLSPLATALLLPVFGVLISYTTYALRHSSKHR